MSMNAVNRPALRYHGGKWVLAPWLIANFPSHRIYVEPFGGAASVLLRKKRSQHEVYNELNEEITNLFKVLRSDGEKLSELLRLTPFSYAEFQDSYKETDDPIERARKTVVRSFMGFGSNVTASKKTGFRRFARKKSAAPSSEWATFPDSVIAIVERMKGVTIEGDDAITCIKRNDTDQTLFYVDPPYPHSLRYDTKMYQFEMTDDNHRELAEVLRNVSGMVVLSGYPCDLYDLELFPDWERRSYNTYADGAKARKEVIWMNQAAVRNNAQLSIFSQ